MRKNLPPCGCATEVILVKILANDCRLEDDKENTIEGGITMDLEKKQQADKQIDLKQRIEWIEYMEAVKDQRADLVQRIDQALSELVQSQEDYQRLLDYYGSEEYRQDVDDSNQGVIPSDIKQGVLSEDEIFDLIGANYELSIRLIEVAALILKNP